MAASVAAIRLHGDGRSARPYLPPGVLRVPVPAAPRYPEESRLRWPRLRASLAILQAADVTTAEEIGPTSAEGVRAKIDHDEFIQSLGG
jgi:hypothetical protein